MDVMRRSALIAGELRFSTAIAVSPDGKTAYVGREYGSSPRVIDTATNSTDGSRAYVSAVVYSSPDSHGSVTVVDTGTNTVAATTALGAGQWSNLATR